jgi:glutamate-5-semialdehyde dehydrogenase
MARIEELTSLEAGTPILFGGNRILRVPEEVARRFEPGDSLIVVEATEELLLIPQQARRTAERAVERAHTSFGRLVTTSDAQITHFFAGFADRLESEDVWAAIKATNDEDVADARRRGRSTTRLTADERLRSGMIDGLRGWIEADSRRDQVIERVAHGDWQAELVGAALGVVGFVFEGRPNVLADATGVLRGGNTVVFRIGSDALRTAKAIMEGALTPALQAAGLPEGAVSLVDSPDHASGWALFSDRRLSLAVARGSGQTVATLGALARQAGVPVSLHGTGGAWIMASESARTEAFAEAIYESLDRKVCNTLNVCCIPQSRAEDLVPVFLDSLKRAGARLEQSFKLHVVEGDARHVPEALFEHSISVRRAEGDVRERQAEKIAESELGLEWEWEQTPEVTLKIVSDLEEAVGLFNLHSPQFIASLISDDEAEHERFYASVNAPFVGDGHTRWVDGQKALNRPELGLSNWQWGRLFGRGGVLSGDTVFTVRTRARGTRK